MDIATLGLRIENGQVVAAKTELEKMGAAGEAAGAKVAAANGARLRREISATEAQVKNLAAAYRAGAIGGDQLLRGSAELQQRADALRRTLVQTERAAGDLGVAATRATPSLRGLREPLTSLAANAAGLDPRLTSLLSTLGMFSVGAGPVIAILAGLAAIAAAMKKLDEPTRKAKEAYDDYLKSLRQTTPLDIVGARLDVARDAYRKAIADYQRDLELSKGAGAAEAPSLDNIRKTREAMLALVKQQQDLLAAFDRTRSESLFDAGLNNAPGTRGTFDAGAAYYEALNRVLTDLRKTVEWYLHPADRNTIFADLTGTGVGAAQQAGLVNAANAAHTFQMFNTAGASPMRQAREDSKDVAESWADSARSALQMVQALGGANDSMLLLLHNVISVGEQMESIAATLKAGQNLSASQVLGGVTAVVGLLSSVAGLLGGESEAERRAREIQEKNTEAIRKLTERIGDFDLGLSGNQFAGVSRGIADLVGRDNLSRGGNPFRGIDNGLVDTILRGQGSSLTDLQAVADALDITLDTSNTERFIDSLRRLDLAIKNTELTQFAETFSGQLSLLQGVFAVFDITDPIQQLQKYLDLIRRPDVGAPGIANQLGQFDLSTAQGRALAEAFIQEQFLRFGRTAAQGGFTPEELGGLSPEELRDLFLTFEGLLDQANEALAGAVDALRDFRDSLALDPALSTLSPVQKLVEARRQYDEVLALAQGGDATAAGRLPEVARALLEASRAVNASGPAYAADYARVMRDTEALEALFGELSGTNEDIARYSGEMANNTATTVARLEDLIAVQQVGMQSLIDQLDGLRTEMAENTRQVKLGFEGAGLA